MNPDTIKGLQARRRLVALQARLAELRAQEKEHLAAARQRLRRRLRYHDEHGTRSSMSIVRSDLRVLLDALDRAEILRVAS